MLYPSNGTFFALILIEMKIAIPLFRNRVSPRFDYSSELLIIEVERGEIIKKEKLSMTNLNPSQRVNQITANGVDKVICGGVDGFTLHQLGNKGVEVVHDVIGEAEVAFDLFMRGRLKPGFCCEKRRVRGPCRWRRGFQFQGRRT